jgi:restriction endonuclease S subunit
MGQLRELHVPVPPVDLQRAFCERFVLIEKAANDADAASAKAEELQSSLLSKTFGAA